MLSGWLGGFSSDLIDDLPQTGRLLTIEEVGEILDGIILMSKTLCFLLHELFENMILKGFMKNKKKTVPVNLKETDAFHITIEEYLQALITLVEELVRLTSPSSPKLMKPYPFYTSFYTYVLGLRNLLTPALYVQTRLAVNSVTFGDYDRPIKISRFVKDIHAGFQTLNLKNDSLRRRSDSIKYNVSSFPIRSFLVQNLEYNSHKIKTSG